ncbi:hypothetical protein [Pseudaquabacterium pictum]|uniref:Uncharacterized protein n=1 Tax=Pseudaquabacterium pictum TaxID=2315236 RepID=A0A480AXK1_9BURK|nr:hypothetical protein [Rubrivivax pictus]GCL64952.1 hypothetical protein AQPW35_40330 [Rubrivivax pictus]
MAAFYDNSPGMVDDLTPPPAAPAAPAAPPAAATPPASNTADMSAPPAPPPADAAEVKARGSLVETLAAQADAMPHGSEVVVHLGRAAEAAGLAGDDAAAVASEWAGTFKAHGIAANDAVQLVDIGASIHRDGPPDEATEVEWLREVDERLRREFGSAEAADRAADLARAWVQRDARLLAWLEATRLGSHPRVVLALAKAAHTAHKAGKWQPK